MSCFDEGVDGEVDGNTAVMEAPEVAEEKTYPVPSRKFTLTGKTLAGALAERFPYQDAREIECRTGQTHVWIGATSDTNSYDGRYFLVTAKKLNQHTQEFTFSPDKSLN